MKNKKTGSIIIGCLCVILVASLFFIGACTDTEQSANPSVSTATVTVTAPATAEKTFQWRLTSTNQEGSVWYDILTKGIAALIEEGSGGRIKCDPYPVGSISGMDEIAMAVTQGSIEAAHVHPGIFTEVPSCVLAEAPYYSKNAYENWELHTVWGLDDLMNKEFESKGLHLLGGANYTGSNTIISTFPINSAADVKGKLAWLSPSNLWWGDFGIVPTDVPGFDMYTGLKLGTIDAVTWALYGLETDKFKEVAKYALRPFAFPIAMQVVVNLDAWNELGPDLQRQLQDHFDSHLFDVSKPMMELEQKLISDMESGNYPVKFTTLPQSEVDKLKKSTQSYFDGLASRSPTTAEGIALYKSWAEYNSQ